jgi:hypothetical protein
MTHRIRRISATAGLLACVAASAAQAAQPADPDWPCVQPLVLELTAAQMWAGPPLESTTAGAANSPELAGLARKLASRSTQLEQAEQAIDQFAGGLAPQARSTQLPLLFQDVLKLINQERGQIIAGIKRYTRKQRRLADKIAQDTRQIGNLQPGTVPDAQTQDLLNVQHWDLRVYEDRQHVLRQICDQPVQLDQRAFALSRAIQARLEPN